MNNKRSRPQSCPLCQSRSIRVAFVAKRAPTIYWQCTSCSYVFTPVLPLQQYEEYHNDDQYITMAGYFENAFEQIVSEVQQYKQSGAVLEIGSSVGRLLRQFSEHGFTIQGVEPSGPAAAFAKKQKIPTIQAFYEETSLPRQYDVILTNHVFEHVLSPRDFLRKVWCDLAPGGVVVFRVPNFGSLQGQVAQGRWHHLIPEEHISQFTPSTLRDVFLAAGFTQVHTKTLGPLTEFASLQRELWRCVRSQPKRLVYYATQVLPTLIQRPLDRETCVQVVATKPATGQ